MDSIKIDVFLSCSFSEHDRGLNDFYSAICNALDISHQNVSYGAPRSPPEQARKMIGEAQALVAICTKRDELKDGTFNMPSAVSDEISFAFGTNIPILAIIENGVNLNGFKEKFGTYLSFDRSKLDDPDFIKSAIQSIHSLKMDVIGPHQMGGDFGLDDSHAENLMHSVELKKETDFIWEYTTTKKVVYTKNSKRSFPTSVFATQSVIIPDNAPAIEWRIENVNSSNGLQLVAEIEEQSAKCVDARLKPHPAAKKGDFIEYKTQARHRYLLPLWEDEAADERSVHLDQGDFRCCEGLLFIHRTKKAILEFRFCSEYGLRKDDVVPFVASYTSGVDFEVPSELARAEVRIDDFGGPLSVRLEIDSALPGHIYGIAWNPLARPVPVQVAIE